MGSLIGGILGLGGGASGTGFASPAMASILQGANTGQANQAYGQTQQSLQQQQALLQALQGQNGLGNQSNVYNQMQGVVNGTGPNPAQAMLNQATGANVANQSALMAGQRGAAQNVGLIARQAGQQGAGIQQQAVGQGATMQANQSLNALNNAGQIANTQAGNQINQTNAITGSQQGQYANILNALNGLNQANVGMQSNVNNANAGLAQNNMGRQGSMLGGIGNAVGALGDMLFAGGGESTFGGQSAFGQFLAGQPMAYGNEANKDLRTGGPVSANSSNQKAVAKGDSYSNDKIPAVLSEHEIVLPRSVTLSEDPAGNAARFVQAVIAKRGRKV